MGLFKRKLKVEAEKPVEVVCHTRTGRKVMRGYYKQYLKSAKKAGQKPETWKNWLCIAHEAMKAEEAKRAGR